MRLLSVFARLRTLFLQPALIRWLFYSSVVLSLVAVALTAMLPVSTVSGLLRVLLLVALAVSTAGIVSSLTLNLYARFLASSRD